ncbi:MAG: hypothetical protein V1816_18250 [Pseudomonadota bacterium]
MPTAVEISFDRQNKNQIPSSLAREVTCIGRDVYLFGKAVTELRWRCLVFDGLRKAMRIALPAGDKGLNDEGDPEVFISIRQGVEQFRQKLDSDPKLAADPLSQKMAKQIDKYYEKLFADPIEVSTSSGKTVIYPNRINNILEQFFVVTFGLSW